MPLMQPVPNTIANGQVGDGPTVQANWDSIVNQLNAVTDLLAVGTFTSLTSTVDTLIPISSAVNDVNTEVAAGIFTAKLAGTYFIQGPCYIQTVAGTTGIANQGVTIFAYVNGASVRSISTSNWPFASGVAVVGLLPCVGYVTLNVLDQLQFYMNATFTGTAPHGSFTYLNIRRVA
jgi:hypothetical protein